MKEKRHMHDKHQVQVVHAIIIRKINVSEKLYKNNTLTFKVRIICTVTRCNETGILVKFNDEASLLILLIAFQV